ncbi:ATP-binding cassette domain-containing protein [Anaerobacillus isosaccharinicus]|uniref:ABC transporter n=1 Tax=Anaerobacillus isosaccharinicus TaxID=1532552 RepID=A0A1S2LDB4_9BACI|nr:ABC transporter ATP-binding protein [Anaerobacillus isosaccharinicus]MBA5588123.1 ABC transporter ATP-binding protein [Anaerobacillus isosaccharinicus]QOY38420.1 ABC transporter ATP-binding protein [Anaerobacillus isosaccharinicus]
MNVIQCENLNKKYSSSHALKNLSFTIEENKITGLIGRNGAGKTTLLKLIAGFSQPSSGKVVVFSEVPFNNLKVSQNMIFIDDNMTLPQSISLLDILYTANDFYENWDMELARRLFDYFSFNPNDLQKNLSKGMKSTFHAIIGLAARCPLTIFDEPTTGMDASVRKDFYRALLKDYLEHPRTILLSSHHLNEIDDLIEDVLLIKNGEKYLQISVEELKQFAIGLSGKKIVVDEWTKGKEIIYKKMVGTDSAYVVVHNDYMKEDLEKARLNGIDISSVAAEDVCVYLTNKTKGGIDDVFDKR